MDSLIKRSRGILIESLLKGDLTLDKSGIPSIADKSSKISVGIARAWLERLGATAVSAKASGQAAGKGFEIVVAEFLANTFLGLTKIRPGNWKILHGADRSSVRITNFVQYNHLHQLSLMAKANPELRAALGGDYLIEPDVVVVRYAEFDSFLDPDKTLLDLDYARQTPIRNVNTSNGPDGILHASISCKWTLRSDRAQNARTEALNLIRNRNGHVPRIVAITAEPMPKRIASLAQGSSDLDCVYHVALPELREAVAESLEGRRSEQLEDLNMLIQGNRLRDISDLPLDLII